MVFSCRLDAGIRVAFRKNRAYGKSMLRNVPYAELPNTFHCKPDYSIHSLLWDARRSSKMRVYNLMIDAINILFFVIAYFVLRKVYRWLTGKEEPRAAAQKKERDLW